MMVAEPECGDVASCRAYSTYIKKARTKCRLLELEKEVG